MRIPASALAGACALSLAATVATAQESHFESLPEDVLIGIAIEDVSALRENWEGSRFADAWKSEEFTAIRETIEGWWEDGLEELYTEEEYTEEQRELISPERLLETFDGFAALYTSHIGSSVSGDRPVSEYNVCFVAELPEEKREDARETLFFLLRDIPAGADKRLEKFRGADIHIISYTEEVPSDNPPDGLEGMGLVGEVTTEYQYAFFGDWFVFAEGPREPAKKAIDALSNPEAKRLGDVPVLRSLKEQTGGLGDVNFWLDTERLLETAVESSADEEAKAALDASGIGGIGPLLATASLTDEGIRQRGAVRMPRERKGFVEMLYAGAPNTISLASRVPADATDFSSWTLDLGPFWKALRKTIVAMNPQADGMISFGLMTAKANMGVDVEGDILPRIAGEHAYYTRPVPGGASAPGPDGELPVRDFGFLFSTTGGDETAVMFNGLMEKMQQEPISQPLESSTVRNTTVWTIPEDGPAFPGAKPPAWGFTPSFILFAPGMREMQDMMRAIDGEDATLAANPAFRRAIDGVSRENLRFLGWTSPEYYISLADQMRWEFDGMSQYDEEFELSSEDIPPPEWWKRYFGHALATLHLSPGYLASDYTITTVGGN